MENSNTPTGYCFLAAVPMRCEPSHRAEMVNQLLLNDTFDILRSEGDWSEVRSHYDGYQGWVDNKQWRAGLPEKVSAPVADKVTSPSDVARQRYLHAPYLWGGRTAMGIDCSGLTQVCFKACGIWLPRDAWQQAEQGIAATLATAQTDDLCFFDNDTGRIVHVGIYLGDGQIIHASGYVRIDHLDEKGIYDAERGVYTHHLHSIRRII